MRFSDGTGRKARVKVTDFYTDLAVLKVDVLRPGVDPLPMVPKPPDPWWPVVALGSSFGYEGKISHGIVSGVNRSMSVALGFSKQAKIQTGGPTNL